MFKTFWTTPLPESIAKLFQPLTNKVVEIITKTKLNQRDYLIRSFGFGTLCIVGFLLLSGTINPFDIFFEIPIFSANDFVATLPYNVISAEVMYYICTAVLVAFSLSIIRLFLLKNEEYPIYTPCGLSYWYMALGISFLCDKASQTIVRFVNQYVGENYSYVLYFGVICIFVFFLYYILDGEMFALDVSITFTPMICDALKFDILNLNMFNIIVVSILLNLILQVLIKLHVLDIFINFIKKWLYTPKYIFYWWYVILLFPIFVIRTILKFIKKTSKNN